MLILYDDPTTSSSDIESPRSLEGTFQDFVADLVAQPIDGIYTSS